MSDPIITGPAEVSFGGVPLGTADSVRLPYLGHDQTITVYNTGDHPIRVEGTDTVIAPGETSELAGNVCPPPAEWEVGPPLGVAAFHRELERRASLPVLYEPRQIIVSQETANRIMGLPAWCDLRGDGVAAELLRGAGNQPGRPYRLLILADYLDEVLHADPVVVRKMRELKPPTWGKAVGVGEERRPAKRRLRQRAARLWRQRLALLFGDVWGKVETLTTIPVVEVPADTLEDERPIPF